MKLIDLIQIRNVFKPDLKFEDIGVTYKVMKFLKQIESDCAFYDNKLMEIVRECAEKDGDNIKTTGEGNICLSVDKIEEWNKKVNDLANLQIEIDLPLFTLDDFNRCDFSLVELSILEPLIVE